MSTLTTNKNFLSPNGFRLTIGAAEFQNLEYFCTYAPLPPISADGIALQWRGKQTAVTGDQLAYSPLNIRFQVSEYMENYAELFNWIVFNSKNSEAKLADIVLHILTSSNNVAKQVRFAGAFPVSLGEIDFHTQSADVEYVTVDASFQYSYFEFVK